MKKKEIKNKKIIVFFESLVNVWTIISVIAIIFCSICLIHENNVSKSYTKVEVTYVKDCSKYNICNNHYLFKVGDKNYGSSPIFETTEMYKKKNYAYYNTNDPSDNMMISKWGYVNLFFIIIIIISTIRYYVYLNVPNKRKEKK